VLHEYKRQRIDQIDDLVRHDDRVRFRKYGINRLNKQTLGRRDWRKDAKFTRKV